MAFDDFYETSRRASINRSLGKKPIAISSVSRNFDSFWQLQKGALVCSLFWTSTTVLQRVSGSMLMHSGRSFYPLTAAWGLACTGASLLVANRGANLAFPEPSKSWGDSLLSWLGSKEKMQRYEEIRAALVGVGVYSALERRSFRTAIPSSVISVGVFAHTPWHWTPRMKSVIAATGEVATTSQRSAVQKLGKLHGCHHCGSKQVFNLAKGFPTNFIADHMPPTKYVNEANSQWHRKLFGGMLRKRQQLLPQCQSCYSKQGAAVKRGIHRLIYHSQLRVWHLAPALAMAACSNQGFRAAIDDNLGTFIDTFDREVYEPITRLVDEWIPRDIDFE